VRSRAQVVLIEDDEEMALALCHVLDEHFEVQLFGDASEALTALRKCRPDLIILDLWTPTMNGWEFRLLQRSDARLAGVPLIAMSADRSPHAAAIDADRFLAKPVTGKDLLACVNDLLAERRAGPVYPALDTQQRDLNAWNATYMTLSDVQDARAHTRMLASELKGFPAARAAALEVLLERAEKCARRGLAYRGVQLPNGQADAPSSEAADADASQYYDLESFLEALDPGVSALCSRGELFGAEASSSGPANLLSILARCLREPNRVPSRLRFELCAEGTLWVRSDAIALAQLLRNLLRNAFEALAGAPAPELRIHVRLQGEFVELCIADGGRGAAVAELDRAFDPFFTTKPAHEGLGLTVARRLAARMDGRLDLERVSGGGTRTRLLVPSAARALVDENASLPTRPSLLLLHHPERSTAIERVLSASFHVVSMTPDEALRHLLAGAEFDVVLCSLVLPSMTGIAFISSLALIHPVQAGRLVILVPPKFGLDTAKLLDQLHIWHVSEDDLTELPMQLRGLLRLWRSLRFR
jgi:signal transduction histidine kinase